MAQPFDPRGELDENAKHQPEEVESHARQITQTARETTRILDEIVWAVNPSNDTLEHFTKYLCKFAQDYLALAGVRCRLDFPEALPALPLALWTLWIRGRGFNGGLRDAGVVLPGVLALVVLVSLSLEREPKLIGVMPLLVPLALVGALEVDSLKRGLSGALDWFGMLTFGLAAMLVWGLWIDSYLNGMSLYSWSVSIPGLAAAFATLLFSKFSDVYGL